MADYRERLNILSLKELKQFIKVYNLHTKIVMTKKKKEELIEEVLKHTELRNGVIYMKPERVADEPQHVAPPPRPKRAPRKRAQPKAKVEPVNLKKEHNKVMAEHKERQNRRAQRLKEREQLLNKPEPKAEPEPEIDFIEEMAINAKIDRMTFE
jgi:hypothetical protein